MIFDVRDFRYDLGGCSPSSFLEIEEAEYVPLPSKGIFYPKPYKNITEIKVKKLTYIEENLLTIESYYHNKTINYEVLRSVIVDKNFPVELMVDIDIVAVLIWVKISGFGVTHPVKYKCVKCNHINSMTWNLGELQLADPVYLPNKNGEIEYQSENKTLYLIPKTLKREKEVRQLLLEKNDSSKTILSLLSTINRITNINNNINHDTIEQIYDYIKQNNLSLKEYRQIKHIAKYCLPTINNKQKVICEKCNYEYDVNFEWNEYSFGLLSQQYRDYLKKSMNFLTFWGRIDYQSALRMPTYKRREWIEMTQENLKILFPKPKR